MRQKILLAGMILLVSAFQISFLPHFFPGMVAPDLLLILIIMGTAYLGFEVVWKIVVSFGVVMDFFYFSPLGLHVLSFVFVSFCVSSLAKRFLATTTGWRFSAIISFVAIGSILNFFLLETISGILQVSDPIEILQNFPLARLLIIVSVNIVVSLLIYAPVARAVRNYVHKSDRQVNVR